MKRITKEMESNGGGKEGNLLHQGVRFAYTIHQVPKKKSHKVICLIKAMFISTQLFLDDTNSIFQFAGGFDEEALRIFNELKKMATSESQKINK